MEKPPWGVLLIMFVVVCAIGGAAYAIYDWTVSPITEPTTESTPATPSLEQAIDACNGLIDGYVEYATRVLGSPPEGWVETEKTDCVPLTLPMLEAGTSKFTDYCTGWDKGQEIARDVSGVVLEPEPCPT